MPHVVGLCRPFLDAQYWTVFSVLSAGWTWRLRLQSESGSWWRRRQNG